MILCIHRGTNEIGGSCVEIASDKTRIIVDIGIPIVDQTRKNFDIRKYRDHSTGRLLSEGILPDIKGLYENSSKSPDGILLSHAHQDHYGLYKYVNQNIKFYLSEPSHRLIELSEIFSPVGGTIKKYEYFKTYQPYFIGDFKITPYLMDHSAFDSHAFLIECGDKRIFYSGDFRNHGRKGKIFEYFKTISPQNVDYLILEGTSLGSNLNRNKSEKEIENEFIRCFKETDKVNIIYLSGQNIDRLVSIIRASIRTKKIIVIDPYIANILAIVSKSSRIPNPCNAPDLIKVYFPQNICSSFSKKSKEHMFFQFKKLKITYKEISEKQKNIVLLARPSSLNFIKKIPDFTNGIFIYSLWKGYMEKPESIKFIQYFKENKYIIKSIHSGGHANISTLKEMVDAINPREIIPIHTFEKNSYKEFFKHPIKQLNDKELLQF
jgi:ribonuclease J